MMSTPRTGSGGMGRALTAALLIPLIFAVRASALDIPALNSAASAKWDLIASRELAASLTDERLDAISAAYGAEQAEALRAKRDAVAVLLERYRADKAIGEDLRTADSYLTAEFRGEIYGLFSAGRASAAEVMPVYAPSAVSAPELERLSALARQGKLTADSLAALFDGSSAGRSAVVVQLGTDAGLNVSAAPSQARPVAVSGTLKAPPALPASGSVSGEKYVRPSMPDIREIGRINKAVSRWDARRRKHLEAYKKADGAGQFKAGVSLSAAALMQGALLFSGLPQVEYAGARLRWDKAHGAPPEVIRADVGKLAFHSAVVIITFLPVPIVPAFSAAFAGNPVAIAYVIAMAAGPANRFIFHFID